MRNAVDMNGIIGIATKIARRQYEFSKHAVDQSIIRNISISEIEEALTDESLIIEDYPNDKYGPSCLILGYTKKGRPLHVQCSYPGLTIDQNYYAISTRSSALA